MHATAILARVLGPCLAQLHAKRKQSLVRATAGLLHGGVASLSAIALSLSGRTRLKHRLKSVDRLLGSGAMHLARGEIYQCVAQSWLAGLARILLVVDWSELTRDQQWQLLRASVVVDGRSITLYEEVHPQSRLAHPAQGLPGVPGALLTLIRRLFGGFSGGRGRSLRGGGRP